MLKYRLLRERVAAELPDIELTEAPAATDSELTLAHTPAYVEAVAAGHLTTAQQREIGFPWSPAMVERSRRSVGASIAAARSALATGFSVNLAGGTHHAHADRGSGFCVFNDVVVAARMMQAEQQRLHQRPLAVAVIDLDVHQGNFPFCKESSDLDVELPDGCGDAEYLAALDVALDRMWCHHARASQDGSPGLIFFLAGADPHEGDRLGRLKLTAGGLAERDRRVFAAALDRRVPVAVSMAGGYGRVIEDTVDLQVNTLRLELEHWRAWQGLQPGSAGRD